MEPNLQPPYLRSNVHFTFEYKYKYKYKYKHNKYKYKHNKYKIPSQTKPTGDALQLAALGSSPEQLKN